MTDDDKRDLRWRDELRAAGFSREEIARLLGRDLDFVDYGPKETRAP